MFIPFLFCESDVDKLSFIEGCLVNAGLAVPKAHLSGNASMNHEAFTADFCNKHSKHLGALDTSRESALRDSLRCGDLTSGFLRVQCPDCDYHYLLPFTCKRLACCPSCYQRRAHGTETFTLTTP